MTNNLLRMRRNGLKQLSLPERKTPFHPMWKDVGRYFVYFIICGWMFFLGVLVGRGTAPVRFDIDQLQKELLELKQIASKKEKEKFETDAKDLFDKPELTFPDALKETGDNIKFEVTPIEPEVEQTEQVEQIELAEKEGILPEKTALETKKESLSEKTESSETRLKPDVSRSQAPDSSRSRTSASSHSQAPASSRSQAPAWERKDISGTHESVKKITIQVASFKDMQDAEKMVARLTERGYDAYIATGEIAKSGTWNRVRIGHFSSRTDARSIMSKLKKENLIGIIVSED